MSIVWLDLETTGLDARNDKILEVGVIITDDKFVELARYHAITNDARRIADWRDVHDVPLQMHAKSGLWGMSLASKTSVEAVDRELAALVADVCYGNKIPEDAKLRRDMSPQLGGNTVDFDREFANVHLPTFAKLLHYRSLNVSSLNELARRVWPDLHKHRPNNPEPVHRVIADIEESIRVCMYYASSLVSRAELSADEANRLDAAQ